MHKDESKVSRQVSKVARDNPRDPEATLKTSRKQEPGQKADFNCSNVFSHVNSCHDGSGGASYLGTEETIPIFVLKYGDVMLPVHGNKADCHVEDLAYAFHDKSFVRGVVNHGNAATS